jgi:hypothetical protein
MQNGNFCIKHKWHWWGSERHVHLNREEAEKLIEELLKTAGDQWAFEKLATIHDE